jgi:hypothetical protein
MIALLLGFVLQATTAVPVPTAGIELNPSDPQGINASEMAKCIAWNGRCNVRYLSGTFHIRRTIHIPYGVVSVLDGVTGTVLVPCPLNDAERQQMHSIFFVEYPAAPPLGAPVVPYPNIVVGVDQSHSCGAFDPPPPLYYTNTTP